ncbi:phosphotransferase enzyme family protein [Streptomyces sp. NPDC048172]|uniref:phosphotransferase enzyme family protein n=1 Tax=Streptomyces sp. NPDC048172 TaxID=3365505 RepID=UPI00371592E2
MPYATTPLSPSVLEAVAREWGLATPEAQVQRLYGGEESAAYRLGDVVVRVGPAWRAPDVAEWCHAVALDAREGGVSEAVAPLRTAGGATVAVVGGRPVSVWPFAEGSWADRDDPAQRAEAARLLGRLHHALRDTAARLPARPGPGDLEEGLRGEGWGSVPALADPALDRWLAAFHARAPLVHALHGDYYRGNLLARDGRLTAVLDWDEAMVGPPALEAATAAREFTEPWATDLGEALAFVRTYAEAGGTAGELAEEDVAQLVRHRLRCESAAYERERARGAEPDADDVAYHERRLELYGKLRP